MTATEQTEIVTYGIEADVSDFLQQIAHTRPQDQHARQVYEWAIKFDSTNAKAHAALGQIALKERQNDIALIHFHNAREHDPETFTHHFNVATSLHRLGRHADARRAVRDFDNHAACMLRGLIAESEDDITQALIEVEKALLQVPGDDEITFFRGLLRAKRNDFPGAWEDMEHRTTKLQLASALDEWEEWNGPGDARQPLIVGCECQSKRDDQTWNDCQICNGTGKRSARILVCREQGLGDEIMFARYLPALKATGAHVIYYTYPALARMFAKFEGVDEIVSEDWELAGKFDYWVAMGSLPLCLRMPPALDAPLRIAPQSGKFRALIPQDGNIRVGLCWAGNKDHPKNHLRSVAFDTFKPLLDTPGCTFYSLQYGDNESGLPVLTSYCHDFLDTCAAIANLDLIITVDTAVAHVAGSMGKPVWLLIGKWPDWRWSSEKPWYPSVIPVRIGDGYNNQDWDGLINTAGEFLRRKADPHTHDGCLRRNPLVEKPEPRELIATRECRYGRMSWYANDHYIGRALAEYGEYSESEAELLASILNPGDVVVEAGANIGGLTLPIAKAVGELGRVIAVEPQRRYCELLEANLSGIPHAEAWEYALGDAESNLELRDIETDKIYAPGWEANGEPYAVGQRTIDSFELERCALIKIDVDGAEGRILQGAERTVARCRPLIYVEYDKPHEYPEMLAWIHAHDYRIYQHNPKLFNPNNYAGNPVNVFGNIVSIMLLCVPMERKDLRHVTDKLERMKIMRKL